MLNYQRVTHHPTFWWISFCIFCIESSETSGVWTSKFQAFYGDRGDVQGAFQACRGIIPKLQAIGWPGFNLYHETYPCISSHISIHSIYIYKSNISHFWYTISAIVTHHIFFQKFFASSTEAALAQELDRVLYITDAWWQWRKHLIKHQHHG